MLIRSRRGWEMAERDATPEGVFHDRRRLLRGMGMLPLMAGTLTLTACGEDAAAVSSDDPTAGLYPVQRNPTFELDRALTDEAEATTYNNYYEFGSHKTIWRAAQELPLRPWTVRFDGMVEKPMDVDIDTLIKAMPLEERLYRFRCVEAWAMAVPWSGFPMAKLVEYAKPLSSARYVVMSTFGADHYPAPGLRQRWYPWPYQEGLTIQEATNELAFIATGLYGKPIPKQNGAPLRLVVPWKYGFKNVKSLVRFHFTDKRPTTFWEAIDSNEYGFWANINPEVPHPRWSQASERLLGTGETMPTRIYNGYGEYVADLYKGLEGERLFT
ncbi:protein-methionine-sulfoxide reductase catalytic subunit MsrP [Indioceanicola profundi]|uniref:protein-methionine-sulfoxide reductase catalytic subunit MsrP n=1 Tax=Indioceanicola profundi TaxID=2220096 RepID=UPI000E6A9CDB|nr:protein-methionine-sulfoxide reductase catalytic subunit MsrP [Indioceanicola profundi]